MRLVRPDIACNFAGIPGTIARHFGSDYPALTLPENVSLPGRDQFPVVCLIFIDAFGWRFLEHFTRTDPIPELVRLRAHGATTKISSQFPSTTAVHVTSIHTGLPVWESGICEWHYYESRVDRVITPLPFQTPFESQPNSLSTHGVSPEQFLPTGWFYPELGRCGVSPHVLLNSSYLGSPYNSIVGAGSKTTAFENHAAGLEELRRILLTASTPTYAFYYFEGFDSAMHRHGPLSTESRDALSYFFYELEKNVLSPVRESDQPVLFLFTADHGMTEMNPETTRYVDRDIPESMSWLKTTKDGAPIYPTGSARDLFLHIQPNVLGEAHRKIAEEYSDIAEIFMVEDLVEAGYFGQSKPSFVFLDNIGDILIAPFAGESVYWLGENDQFMQVFRGHHGGLTADEMESIFLTYPAENR